MMVIMLNQSNISDTFPLVFILLPPLFPEVAMLM